MKRQKKRFTIICNQINCKKIPDHSNTKEYHQSYLKKKKDKIGKTIKNNCSVIKNVRKPKHCWHKISYYRTSENFS